MRRRRITSLAASAALLAVGGTVGAAAGGAFASGGGRPGPPHVGDRCTNLANGNISYQNGGPGFIEQTAFGLVCQQPISSTTTPAMTSTTVALQAANPTVAARCTFGNGPPACTQWGYPVALTLGAPCMADGPQVWQQVVPEGGTTVRCMVRH